MPKDLHTAMKYKAVDEDTTVSWLFCEAVVKHFKFPDTLLHGTAKTKEERRKNWEAKQEKKSKKRTSRPVIEPAPVKRYASQEEAWESM